MKSLVSNNTTSTLASGILLGATSFTVATGEGALFPLPANPLEDFYVRLGNSAVNEVVRCTARSADTITCIATTSAWDSGTAVIVAPCKELHAQLPKIINADTTITVKASGGNFTSLALALTALQDVMILPSALVTIEVDDGYWTNTAPLYSNQLCANRIKITGKTVIDYQSITGIQSSSGTSGNYSVVVNLDASTTMSSYLADMFVIIDSAYDGTNPERLLGCHRITDVDTPNKRITLSVSNIAGVPSGAVTTYTMKLLKTVIMTPLESNGDSGWASIENIGLFNEYALSSINNGSLKCGVNVGIRGGITASFGGTVRAIEIVISGSGSIAASTNGSIDVTNSIITGFSNALGAYDHGVIDAQSSYITGNDRGIFCAGGRVNARQSNLVDNVTGDAYASRYGFVYVDGATYTTLSPAINTQGNHFGYICDD